MRSPKIKTEIRAILTDKNGKIVRRYPWKRANSLLKAFIQLLTAHLSQESQTILDTIGSNRTGNPGSLSFKCNATTETDFGIVIGTGETPVAMTNNKLLTQVTANITHGTVTFTLENPDASTWRVAISRAFTNNTGATLGVKEVGLYVNFADSTWNFCVDRTLYAVDVPDGLILTLTYKITISL